MNKTQLGVFQSFLSYRAIDRGTKIFLRTMIFCLCFIKVSFAQTQKINSIDSCHQHSIIFKDTLNICNGSAIKSFNYLKDNCLVIGRSTLEDVVTIFGNNYKDLIIKHNQETEKKYVYNTFEYDYHVDYTISAFCYENNVIIHHTSTIAILFFKDDVLIKILDKTFG